MASNAPTFDLTKFLGIRNVGQSKRLPLGALESAYNVDVDDEGTVVSRVGFVEVDTFTDLTAAYTPMHQEFAYAVDNGNLYRIDANQNKTLIGTVPNVDTHWAEAGNYVFLSSGDMVEGNRLIPWALYPPEEPICTIESGSLPAGIYQITATQDADDGRESPSCAITTLELTDGQGIHIANAAGKNIYMTSANDSVLMFVGVGVEHIDNDDNLYIPLEEELITNNTLPDDIECIAYYDTTVAVSKFDQGNNVSDIYFSKPFYWHVFDIVEDSIKVPGEVRLLVNAGANLIIGTDREIYAWDGDLLVKLANYGVPKGHLSGTSKQGFTLIYTNRGPCSVEPFKNLTEDKVSLPPGNHASTAIIEQEGITKFIALTDGEGTANNKVN